MIHIRNLEERRKTVDSLLKFIKDGKVSIEQKDDIYKIVMSMKKTELQKKRFCMVYSLGPNLNEKNTYKKIASFYECSVSNIRGSVLSIVVGLARIPEEQMNTLRKIVEICDLKSEIK